MEIHGTAGMMSGSITMGVSSLHDRGGGMMAQDGRPGRRAKTARMIQLEAAKTHSHRSTRVHKPLATRTTTRPSTR